MSYRNNCKCFETYYINCSSSVHSIVLRLIRLVKYENGYYLDRICSTVCTICPAGTEINYYQTSYIKWSSGYDSSNPGSSRCVKFII